MKFKKLAKNYREFLTKVGEICEIGEDYYIDSIDVGKKEVKVRYTNGKGNTHLKKISVKDGTIIDSQKQVLEKWQERLANA